MKNRENRKIVARARKNARRACNNFDRNSAPLQKIWTQVAPLYNMLIKQFSDAVDAEDYELAKNLYKKLLEMTHPESQERKIMKLDMEMIEPDDKTQ